MGIRDGRYVRIARSIARSLCRMRLFPSVCYRLYGSLLPDSSVALVVATMTKPFQGPTSGSLQLLMY